MKKWRNSWLFIIESSKSYNKLVLRIIKWRITQTIKTFSYIPSISQSQFIIRTLRMMMISSIFTWINKYSIIRHNKEARLMGRRNSKNINKKVVSQSQSYCKRWFLRIYNQDRENRLFIISKNTSILLLKNT
jgi:hypothetical protein